MVLIEEFYSRYKHRRSKFYFPDNSYDNDNPFNSDEGDLRDMLQLAADLGLVQNMGDKRTFHHQGPIYFEKL